jgi:hypothetical protein
MVYHANFASLYRLSERRSHERSRCAAFSPYERTTFDSCAGYTCSSAHRRICCATNRKSCPVKSQILHFFCGALSSEGRARIYSSTTSLRLGTLSGRRTRGNARAPTPRWRSALARAIRGPVARDSSALRSRGRAARCRAVSNARFALVSASVVWRARSIASGSAHSSHLTDLRTVREHRRATLERRMSPPQSKPLPTFRPSCSIPRSDQCSHAPIKGRRL